MSDLYDEFGNYIGDEIHDQQEDLDVDVDDVNGHDQRNDDDDILHDDAVNRNAGGFHRLPLEHEDVAGQTALQLSTPADQHTAVVLHEDIDHYPEARAVYGDNVDITVGAEDTQPLSQSIIQPLKSLKYSYHEETLPETTFSYRYLLDIMSSSSSLTRNVSVLGSLHSGKTSLLDILISSTHPSLSPDVFNPTQHDSKPYRYLDIQYDEQQRELTLKAMSITLLQHDLSDKSYAVTYMDTPGHIDFGDEVTSALRVTEGCILVVDAVDGITEYTRELIHHAISQCQHIVFCINKIDRLIVESKLPPTDTYFKLLHIIEEANSIIYDANELYHHAAHHSEVSTPSHNTSSYIQPPLHPSTGNVIFASALHGWSFTVPSFAHFYALQHSTPQHTIDVTQLSKRIWGDWYYSKSTRKFTRTRTKGMSDDEEGDVSEKRTFISFILEPLYKLYSHVLGIENDALNKWLYSNFGIKLRKKELQLDANPLLKLVCQRFFISPIQGWTSSLVQHIHSPHQHAAIKTAHIYTGPMNTQVARGMMTCDSSEDAILMIQINKCIARNDASRIDCFGRVMSGQLNVGDAVRVLGQGYTLDDTEDSSIQRVTKIWLLQGRYRIEINRAVVGMCILVEGIDNVVSKSATVTTNTPESIREVEIFRSLEFMRQSTMRVALLPYIPSELPKMLHALRCVNKIYPLAHTRVEESGEHVLIGTGELYIDCILYDIRNVFAQIDIKISDPSVTFMETVSAASSVPAVAETPNHKNTITLITEPLSDGIVNDMEMGLITEHNSSLLSQEYHWDALAIQSIWSISGTNILIDDTLLTHSDDANDIIKGKLLYSIKDSIINGFQWSCRESALCDEPMRGVCVKILDIQLSCDPILRTRGQLIPTTRRAIYTAFLLSQPRLMEPVLQCEVLCANESVIPILTRLLQRRRGIITSNVPKAGTPLTVVSAYIPQIDSFGFEVDLRTATHGAAFVEMRFHHWSIVPGDPLDPSIVLRALEPAPRNALAREFMLKTRRRKGLADNVSVSKYVDDAMLQSLAETVPELPQYIKDKR